MALLFDNALILLRVYSDRSICILQVLALSNMKSNRFQSVGQLNEPKLALNQIPKPER